MIAFDLGIFSLLSTFKMNISPIPKITSHKTINRAYFPHYSIHKGKYAHIMSHVDIKVTIYYGKRCLGKPSSSGKPIAENVQLGLTGLLSIIWATWSNQPDLGPI